MKLDIIINYRIDGKEKEHNITVPCSKKQYDNICGKNGNAAQEMSQRLIDSLVSDIAHLNSGRNFGYCIVTEGAIISNQ